jgi:hypothetical protein
MVLSDRVQLQLLVLVLVIENLVSFFLVVEQSLQIINLIRR